MDKMIERITSDLTVIGGGIAGMCAAIAAARKGLKVALVNDRPVLGGNASSEIRVSINGAAYNGNSPSVYAREGGIVEEIKLRIVRYGCLYNEKLATPMMDAAYFDMVYNEPNISLFLNTVIHNVSIDNGEVKEVFGVMLGSQRELVFESALCADCSGDGIVGYKAGAHYMWGRESKEQFNESLAPEQADSYVLGDTMLFR